MKTNSNLPNLGTMVTIKISSTANDLLTKSAKKSKRSKKSESELRLEDHLHKFDSINRVGDAKIKK
ncbi:TraY domain-containing protein [Candidatus Williamhamiltonella defendens]|uniref:Relaxosome protein TraY n=1 Tax=Candidatus Hamiltonella defensa (Bemisia tabaci) TaxID=672795 RepID=A0A249DZG5_9ENTR|nr:TraY domain-containing protein [Candidatus Hamiltonella defensa]ASX26944.1 hypothetical protein BA171_08120 [Candidatus Hamiltonella defensa (Bemisia tabaci)]